MEDPEVRSGVCVNREIPDISEERGHVQNL